MDVTAYDSTAASPQPVKLGSVVDSIWASGFKFSEDRAIQVSSRDRLADAIVSIGVSKTVAAIDKGLPLLGEMMRSARKTRMMGSATLDIAYVATGRLDAYIESQISLWDIAAGLLMVELAGGVVDLQPHATVADKFSILASSGKIAFSPL